MADAKAGESGAMQFRGPPPPPPPPVVPVASVEAARESAAEATGALEATMVRAASFSDEELHRSVNDEWCTVDSLRHIVLIVDLWLSKSVLGEQDPFHPIALPPTFMPPKLPGTSIDPDAQPTFDEACEVVRGRLATVRTSMDDLTPETLDRPVASHAKTVGGALGVLFGEMEAHNRFINRDLDIIESSRSS
jgi:DinB superfamily